MAPDGDWPAHRTSSGSDLARIFHQDADWPQARNSARKGYFRAFVFWVVLGEPGRARPSQPIDHSIGKAGGLEMAVQNGPETV